ncbi:glutathione S-transferase T2-like isoform X4 [Panicum hallii]|uniref:glutathione S-transferase T2-like isoform X4 n=1 Tax=Panicum hallii TaxID=206008 RepID=UPI000DF4CB5F|nr:glutathione S-transferase T2-like isoform X4 [Panicum hallii]
MVLQEPTVLLKPVLLLVVLHVLAVQSLVFLPPVPPVLILPCGQDPLVAALNGGFVNFVQGTKFPPFTQPHPFVNYPNGSQLPENFHFVSGTTSHSTMPPTDGCSKGTPSPTGSSGTAQMGSQDRKTIDVEDDGTIQPARSNGQSNVRSIARSTATPDARSDRRLNWSIEEDIRLVSAWLHNSIDPVDGNNKKSDQYWSDVTSTYNSSTKCNRMRNRNQLKLRWERIKKPVTEFNGCYARITKVHQSGMSDDQKMDQAMQLYAYEHSDRPFTLLHVWRIVRHEKKWSAYVKKLSKEKKNSKPSDPAHVVNVDDATKQRPIGHKKAKDERNGKRKEPEAISAISDKLDRFIEASSKAEKIVEVHEKLANKKLEVAKEQTKSKMIDLYRDLLCLPTSDLSDEAKAERSKALECMTLALFDQEGARKDDECAFDQVLIFWCCLRCLVDELLLFSGWMKCSCPLMS